MEDAKKLLQQLWDEFVKMHDKIGDIVDDEALCDVPDHTLNAITADTPDMKKLRRKMFDVGIKRIRGMTYK